MQSPEEQLWFLDESEFNLHTAPLRAWSQRGETPVQPVHANRQRNVTLLMVVTPDGIKHFELRDGAFKARAFQASMRALARLYCEPGRGEVTLVMDNAPFQNRDVTRCSELFVKALACCANGVAKRLKEASNTSSLERHGGNATIKSGTLLLSHEPQRKR